MATKVTSAFDELTRPERVKVLILDDSIIQRNRSKNVELLAKVYDHVSHKFQKGFTLLTLGWSDGYSFIPVGFNMLSSANKDNRYQEVSTEIDHRTNGYKCRAESLMKKTDAAILLIQRALNSEIKADYVLMDTWFTTEPMLKEILKTGLDAMVSHTTIVFTRYIILEWIRRNQNDQKTYGELFHMFCDDIQDMDLTNALTSLMALFVKQLVNLPTEITNLIKSKVSDWMKSQALFIQALFGNLCWES